MTTPTKDRELLEQALEDLCSTFGSTNIGKKNRTIAALRARLAQPDAIGVAGGEAGSRGKEMAAVRTWALQFVAAHDDSHTSLAGVVRTSNELHAHMLAAGLIPTSAPKSGDMAQGEQETSGLRMELATAMRYIEERDERIKELKAEIANLRFAIERIQTLSVRAAKLTDALLAHPAASTGAGQISDDVLRDAVRYRWVRDNSKREFTSRFVTPDDDLNSEAQFHHTTTFEGPRSEVFDAMVDAAIAAAQPKGKE